MAADMPVAHRAHPTGVTGGQDVRLPDMSFAVPISPQLDEAPGTLSSVVVGPDADAAAIHHDALRSVAVRAPSEGANGSRGLATGLCLLDLCAVLASFVALDAIFTRSATAAGRLAPGLLAAVATLGAMRLFGLYRSRNCATPASHLWRLCASGVLGGAVLVASQSPTSPPWRLAAVSTTSAVAASGIGRWWYRRVLRARRARGRHLRSVLLIGSNDDAAALRTTLRSEPELGYSVAGVVAGPVIDPALTDLPVGFGIEDIPRLAAITRSSGIVIVPYGLSSAEVERAVNVGADAGLHVQIWPGLRGIGDGRLRSVPVSGEPFFYVEPRSAARWQLVTKRVIDVVGATVALLCAAPVLAVCAVVVKLCDRGPVFYRGERVGMHGKAIYPPKLRTMVTADLAPSSTLNLVNQRTDGPLFKSSADPRVTRVGRFLRATSLDELPQLWTVLMGTMSLVGPRPALPDEVAAFDRDFLRRHSVRPGMTGLWQVEARDNPSFNAYRRLDLRYVDNWSLRLDLSILASTVPAVVGQAWRALRDGRHAGR